MIVVEFSLAQQYLIYNRGVAQSGFRAFGLGPKGRGFESLLPDNYPNY